MRSWDTTAACRRRSKAQRQLPPKVSLRQGSTDLDAEPSARDGPAHRPVVLIGSINTHMQPPFSRTAYELLVEQALRAPDALAAITVSDRMSYGDLAHRAGQVAAALRARGIGRGDRVGLLVNNRIEWLEIFFGAAALGAVVVPFSTWSKRAELDFVLQRFACAVPVHARLLWRSGFLADIAALRADTGTPSSRSSCGSAARRRTGELAYAGFVDGEPLAGAGAGRRRQRCRSAR